MTQRLWIFPTILCLLCAITFTEGFSIVGFILFMIWVIRILALKNRPILFVSLLISLFFLLNLHHHQEDNHTVLKEDMSSFRVYPEVTTIRVDGNRVRFKGLIKTETDHEIVVVHYLVRDEVEKNQWLEQPPQTLLHIEGQLEQPSNQRNFYQFSYRDYLRREHIHWLLKADEIHGVQGNVEANTVRLFTDGIRHSIFQYIDSVFTSKIATYLKTLLFADKRQFSEEVLESYQALGVIHLFSISGFHISFLITFIRRFLLRIGLTHERTNLFLVLLLPLYGLIAGMGVSIFRAVMQNMIVLSFRIFNKEIDSMDSWAVTMILAMYIQPYQIYYISFQLSYTLSGIFILMGQHKWTRELSVLQYSLLFSLLSALASLPILTYHFFEFSWIALLANLLFIPFFSQVLFPSILFLFLSSFFLSGTTIFYLTERALFHVIQLMEEIITLMSDTFDFSFITGRLSGFLLVGLVISLFLIIKKIEVKQIPRPIYLLFVLFFLCFNRFSPIGQITLLDVGQGDTILAKAPYGQGVTLIDTGGMHEWGKQEEWMKSDSPFSVGESIVVPTLKALGISAIDRLYITHADSDHSSEILKIGNILPIKEIAATKHTFLDGLVKEQILPLKHTELMILEPPDTLTFPNNDSLALYPIEHRKKDTKNNQSLVLYATIGEDKWLFTGDIEREAEQRLMREYPTLKVDYLKVSHHGSQTSTSQDFIDHIQPSYALISAGRNNSFGHPHQEVLEVLKQQQVATYVTSETGAISVRYLYLPFVKIWLSEIQTVH